MASVFAWLVFALGVGHLGYAIVVFGQPLLAGVAGGIIGQFNTPEIRRTAFWFLMFGPLLMLAGHVAVHAVEVGDMKLYKLVGFYLLVISAIGALALPKSPFSVALIVTLLLLASGYKVI
jgi:hypothetical protein